MESLDAAALPEGALLPVDSAPIIFTLEANERFAAHFAPLFQRHADGELAFAVTTITIADVLSGSAQGRRGGPCQTLPERPGELARGRPEQ